jgi:hypothetical protein
MQIEVQLSPENAIMISAVELCDESGEVKRDRKARSHHWQIMPEMRSNNRVLHLRKNANCDGSFWHCI